MLFKPDQPYEALPLLPPATDLESKAVLKACLAATRALAELKGTGGLIPDQTILINAIPLQEAKASSEIENIVTTQDNLFRGAANEEKVKDPATKEVLRYRAALRHGYEALGNGRPLDLNVILNVCQIIHDDDSIDFRRIGENVYIGNHTPKRITYTPPSGGRTSQTLLKNLEHYILKPDADTDPLVRMAVAHYQFEAIHPFLDGNGRTGRILNLLMLIDAGLLDIPVLYLSRYVIEHKTDYYRLLQQVTESQDWEPWLLYVLEGIRQTALWTRDRVIAIRDLFDTTVKRVRAEAPSIYTKELIELIFRQPYCKIAFVVDAGIAKRQTAGGYLKELERLGVLKSDPGGRETLYRHPALIDVLSS
ncbi:MAG: Fic family protein [Algisphaera sp.]